MCFDFLYSFDLKIFTFLEEFSEILSQMYTAFRVNYPLFLSNFNQTLIFFTDFRKILKCQIS
jgi:hypothetical protein